MLCTTIYVSKYAERRIKDWNDRGSTLAAHSISLNIALSKAAENVSLWSLVSAEIISFAVILTKHLHECDAAVSHMRILLLFQPAKDFPAI